MLVSVVQQSDSVEYMYVCVYLSPSPGGLPNPGIEPRSPALQVDSLPSKLPGKPIYEREREGNSNSLQYSCREGPMDGGAW